MPEKGTRSDMAETLELIRGALKNRPALSDILARSLRQRVNEDSLRAVAGAARALQPVLERDEEPGKLLSLSLKGVQTVGRLADDDLAAAGRLARFAGSSSVGIVFVDIVDFTRFTEENGDDVAIRLLGRIQRSVESAVKVGKGEVVKALGDGFLLVFPSASQAVRSAVELQRREHRKLRDAGPSLRISVHAGTPSFERDDLLGLDVNIASRLLEHAGPGTILVSERAKAEAERRLRKIRFSEPRTVALRGLKEPMVVHEALESEPPTASP